MVPTLTRWPCSPQIGGDIIKRQLKLVAVDAESNKEHLSDKNYLLIPVKGRRDYQEQTPVMQSILAYYEQVKPTIVAIQELSCDSNEVWWPCHWTDVIHALTGVGSDNVIYIGDWNIAEDTVHSFIPEDHNGTLLNRGGHVPILLEVTKNLIDSCGSEMCYMCDIWNYGTRGYILPKSWEKKFALYTTREEIGMEEIKAFYENVTYTFWMGGEIDIMYLVSHKYDVAIVQEILANAKSNHFYL